MREVFEKEIWDQKVSVHSVMIQDFIQNHGKENTIFVSPTNSLGRMEGGIDLIMSRQIFPNVNRKLYRMIKLLGIVGKTGQYILPVGSGLFFPDHPHRSGLITTPVMYNSSSIGHTENVYVSILVSLILFIKINLYRQKESGHLFQNIVITSHGCGNGAMNEKDSIMQIRKAYDDFYLFYENKNRKDEAKYQEIEIELGNVNPSFFCMLSYEEKEPEMALIDQNNIKTIRFVKNIIHN